MESISLPKKVSITQDSKNDLAATLVIEPLYPGYGSTIANSLRRVLLSSLPGAAVYAFKIKGVTHEFTAIDHVKEDVVDISLNLKRVNLKSHSDEPVMLTLKATGEKKLTAGDIEKNADVEIANPDQVILTLTDKAADVEMTLWVREGRGYNTVESREEEELEVNAISVDSIFTPIRQVGYQVDNVRKGARTDYDKITMHIESNGTIDVEEAVKLSSAVLSDHFNVIGEMKEESDEVLEAEEESEDGEAPEVPAEEEEVKEEKKEE
jgi:DNA-directed RNA polymerase subunit alpha